MSQIPMNFEDLRNEGTTRALMRVAVQSNDGITE
jgi:hypothetical protein